MITKKTPAMTMLLLSAVSINTLAASDERGFSYFLGVGTQSIEYQEKASTMPLSTDVDVSNPILISGALYALSQNVLFSIDSETTFAANADTETWTANSNEFYGSTLESRVLQTNEFTLQQQDTRIFMHYRLKDHLFLIGGPSMRSQTFKRFAFSAGPDDAVEIIAGQVIEESSSEVLGRVGIALESEQLSNKDTHYGVRFFLGKPLWREVTNTALPAATFDEKGGLDVAIEARYSFAVLENIHLGAWLQIMQSDRDGQKKCVADPSPDAQGDITNECDAINPALTLGELPESGTRSASLGVEALWKL